MKRSAHITLDDIAKKLKVSRVTVSKALRGHPDISEKTANRIRKLASELGYSPNFIARNLSARRSNMLGVVIPKIAHFFFGSVIEAIYNTAFDHNYETILTVSQENAEREKKHIQTLVSMRVDGMIISVSQETRDAEIFRWIKKMGIHVVFVDRMPGPGIPGFSSVLVDDKGGAFQAIEHAIKTGYRKIGFVGGNPEINIGRNRLLGFEQAMKQYNVPINSAWVVHAGFGKADGYEGFKRLYQSGQMPEFVFAVTYPVALGIYEAAKELGLRIPDDIDIICFGDSDVNRFLSPSLSCVHQPTQELGTKAVEMILDMINNSGEVREQHLEIPTELILRETCLVKKPTRVEALKPIGARAAAKTN
ncbi:MAG: LacI family DNA-binding transcriptional regulator [Ignavibacteriales bacterium]|nr:LacI family DNA-binding transcriptional regulator [Ignavibacteriales bacterium]